jgi:hypothetical protein
LGRTGAGGFGLGANVDFGGAGSAFFVAGPVAFLAAWAPAAPFAGGAAFFAVGAAVFAAGAVFLMGAVFFADDAARFEAGADADPFREDPAAALDFLAGDAALFVVVPAFFTDTAFFWAERLWEATDLGEDLFPAGAFFAAAIGRDRGALFAGLPLLAGVIVSSLTTQNGRFPVDDLAEGAGDDTGTR